VWDLIARSISPPYSNQCRRIHPRRSFDCQSTLPCDHLGHQERWSCSWRSSRLSQDCISRQCSNYFRYLLHPTQSFHFQSKPPFEQLEPGGAFRGARSCPTVRARIVSPASIQFSRLAFSTPDDHFTTGPYCRVNVSGRGRVDGVGGCPTIRARIVSTATVE
jgi:hypothetical protein